MRWPFARTSLSREGRDTLWLLAVLALSILPHAERLPLWCALGTGAAIVWRAQVAWRDGALPPRWLLMVCLAASIGLTLWSFKSLFGREAGVTLVTLLAGLKTLELRARRDAFVVTSLGFFLILTQFLYSQSLPIALLMSLVLMGLLTSLVLAQRPTGRPSIWSAMKVAARSVVMGIPVMLALFLFFPRLGPLWSVPADAGQRTGLSNQISLGNVAELALDDTVAMRVRFIDAPPVTSALYFRGPVLDVFDGLTWRAREPRHSEPDIDDLEPVRHSGTQLRYQLTVEPNRIATVPLLDGTLAAVPTPPSTEPQLRRQGLSWTANRPLTERSQLDAVAWKAFQAGPSQPVMALNGWLQLPAGFNPRTLQWASTFRSQPGLAQADARALSNAVMTHIRQAGYSYTLSPGDGNLDAQGLPERNVVDRFWMDSKSGFCEHFATAYVVVMRTMGVPSRVVTGFQGAELNPIDGLHVVRNSDAHAWAEFWQAGEGWVRVDPTAAVAPERIERARQVFRNRDALTGPLSQIDPAVWGRLRAYVEASNHRWNIWVLQYSRNRQMDLLRNWGFDSPDWTDLVRLCGVVLLGVSLLGLVWLWWTRPRLPHTPWQKPLLRVHRALLAAGLPAPADCPAPAPALSWVRNLARLKAKPAQEALRQPLIDALSQLDALRYAPQSLPARQLKQEQAQLIDAIVRHAQAWRQAGRRDQAN